jgi:hypothetical protein
VVIAACRIITHLRLVKYGAEAIGHVTDIKKTIAGYVGDRLVSYDYPDSSGEMHSGRFVADDFQVHVDQPIPVLYDPMRPQRSGAYGFMDAELLNR